jgi:transcriptional regulator with XRE-family HTH domain
METLNLRSSAMSPERTRRLLTEVQNWCQTHNMQQKDLAALLGISPQRLNDILTGRRNTQPTGEQVLQLQELLKTKPKATKRKPKSE